jgi:hypothetical protein
MDAEPVLLEFLPRPTIVGPISIIAAEKMSTKHSTATIPLLSSHLTEFRTTLLRSQRIDHVGGSQIHVPSLQQVSTHSGLELRTLGTSMVLFCSFPISVNHFNPRRT